jgi:hypothetical protein
MVNQISDKEIYPEEHRDLRTSLKSDEDARPVYPACPELRRERAQRVEGPLSHSYTLTLLHSHTLLSFSKSPMAFTKAMPFERSSLMR